MKKFEIGKVYRDKKYFGCGYDSNVYYYYFKITRRTNSTIWFNVKSVHYEAWGSPLMKEDQADHIGYTEVNSPNCPTGRARISLNNNAEFFKFDNNWCFIEYVKEFKEE